jgi:transposase
MTIEFQRKSRLIRERHKDPTPRFLPDICGEVSRVWGCLDLQLPEEHLAREVKEQVALLDLAALEAKYSSQGRHGYHPRHMLGCLVYASRIGLHYSTDIANALQTDAALRFVAGGHRIAEGTLRAFRRENGEHFANAVQETVKLAQELGVLDTSALAVDSVRLHAEASTRAVRTEKRSRARLAELAHVDVAALDDVELAAHQAKVLKHTEALRVCNEQQRPNIVTTSPGSGLMSFPDGGSGPGFRVTTVGCGVQLRLIIDVFIDGTATDFGKLAPAVLRTRKALTQAGVPLDTPIQIAADAGYFSTTDLVFAAKNTAIVDALIAEGTTGRRKSAEGLRIFTSDAFTRDAGGALVCPAGTKMSGPFDDAGRERWHGKGCGTCALKAQCTSGKYRTVTIDTEFHEARQCMRERMAKPDAKARYNQRIATIEPIFSGLVDGMAFRRVSSLKEDSARAEIMLKVLAYNLGRLSRASRLRHVRMIAAPTVPEGDGDET